MTRGWLRVLSTPKCWIQIHPYSAEWDRKLRVLLDEHDFVNIGPHRADLGGVDIWIANRPYGSMYPPELSIRASRITTLEACDKFVVDAVEAS